MIPHKKKKSKPFNNSSGEEETSEADNQSEVALPVNADTSKEKVRSKTVPKRQLPIVTKVNGMKSSQIIRNRAPIYTGNVKATRPISSHPVLPLQNYLRYPFIISIPNSKHTPNRTSKTDCLNKLMQSQFIKKKKRLAGLAEQKDLSEKASLVVQMLEESRPLEEEADDEESYAEEAPPNMKLGNKQDSAVLGSHEYLLAPSDEDGPSSPSQPHRDGKKKLKITVPTVSYKYVKDSMFPDSKVKNEKFLRAPYPLGDFDDTFYKDSANLISPMLSKKGNTFLHMTFSPSGMGSAKQKEATTPSAKQFNMVQSDTMNEKMNLMLEDLKSKICLNAFDKRLFTAYHRSNVQGALVHHASEASPLNKRMRPESNLQQGTEEMIVPIPLKKLKKEEASAPVTPRGMQEPFVQEVQTPKLTAPPLNINLIDSTYQFREVINNMWEEAPAKDNHFKAHYQSGDEQFDEFELKEEFN